MVIDILDRDVVIEHLYNLINNSFKSNKSITIAMDGCWGIGKSFVLNRLINKFQNESIFIVKYNCWHKDYYPEPLFALVSAILEDTVIQYTSLSGRKEKIFKLIKTFSKNLMDYVVSEKLETLEPIPSISFKDLKNIFESSTNKEKNLLKEFKRLNESLTGLDLVISTLQKLLRLLSFEMPILFIIDEIDRCSPEYAIKVLERLHHVTEDNTNLVTLFSVDYRQLEYSIQQIYGINTDTTQYLRKFFDLKVKLDSGIINDKIMSKYNHYFDGFKPILSTTSISIKELFQALFFQIPIREQEHILYKVELFHKMIFEVDTDISILIAELLIAYFLEYENSIPHHFLTIDSKNRTIKTNETIKGNEIMFSNLNLFFRNSITSLELNYIQNIKEEKSGWYLKKNINPIILLYYYFQELIDKTDKKLLSAPLIVLENDPIFKRLQYNQIGLKSFIELYTFAT